MHIISHTVSLHAYTEVRAQGDGAGDVRDVEVLLLNADSRQLALLSWHEAARSLGLRCSSQAPEL